MFLESNGQVGEFWGSAFVLVLCRAMGSAAQGDIFIFYMLLASDLLAPYDKTKSDPERYLYLVVKRKIWPKHMLNTATQTRR